MAGEEEWKILAEEAAQEKDPKKLMEILNALTAALDEQQKRKKMRVPMPSDGI
jgi:hypothetical protein